MTHAGQEDRLEAIGFHGSITSKFHGSFGPFSLGNIFDQTFVVENVSGLIAYGSSGLADPDFLSIPMKNFRLKFMNFTMLLHDALEGGAA